MAPFAGVRSARGSLMGGTLARLVVVVGPCVGWWRWWASVHCWVLREHTLVGVSLGCGLLLLCTSAGDLVGLSVTVSVCVGVSRVLFENCTVDASIFVAKFVRAHGGCLGTRSR